MIDGSTNYRCLALEANFQALVTICRHSIFKLFVLRPKNLKDHLTTRAIPQENPQYMRRIVKEELLCTWILDSMTTELANCFIEYSSVQEIWDAAQQYHSKKNDKAKIAELVIKARALQQGEKTVLAYANELRMICSELHHYRPPVHYSMEREYTLMDRVYQLLQDLRPEFESLSSQLCNRDNPISFDDTVSQLIGEDSRLQDMKGSGEGDAYVTMNPEGTASSQQGQSTSTTGAQKNFK